MSGPIVPGSRNGLNPSQGFQGLNSVLADSITLQSTQRGLNQPPQINVRFTNNGTKEIY